MNKVEMAIIYQRVNKIVEAAFVVNELLLLNEDNEAVITGSQLQVKEYNGDNIREVVTVGVERVYERRQHYLKRKIVTLSYPIRKVQYQFEQFNPVLRIFPAIFSF